MSLRVADDDQAAGARSGRCCRSPRAGRRRARQRPGPSVAGGPAVPQAREAHPLAAKTSLSRMPNTALQCGLVNPSGQVGMDAVKRSRHSKVESARSGRGAGQVAIGIDAPALADRGQLLVERPAVGALLALVLGAGALQRHAAGVVADRADLGDVLGAEPLLGRQRRQLGPLRLDRAGVLARPPGSGSGRRTRPPGGRGSTGRRAGSSSARPARRSARSAPASRCPASIQPSGGRRGGRRAASSMPGRRSSQKRPP